MERLLEGCIKQSWCFLALKFFIFAALTAAIFCEVYMGLATGKSYQTSWTCHSKAAFTHPNPYFGDVNVTEEFSNIIDWSLLLAISGVVTAILGSFMRLCREETSQVIIVMDVMLAFGCFSWLVLATVARFSHTGRVCSGAYQGAAEIMYPYDY